jgi:tRNA(Ile)-lysidine synthase
MKFSPKLWERRAGLLAELVPVGRLQPEALQRGLRAPRRAPWMVAFSGGADSLTLLLLLWAHWPERRSGLHALHFNHRLRGVASDRDEAYCRKVCRALGIGISVGRRYGKKKFTNEAESRDARFEFIGRKMQARQAKVLWLGHQQKDIAESMLMRLARGSGTTGLAAPRPVQSMTNGRLHLRPLLGLKHEELTTALAKAGLTWREDTSNHAADYFRNRVRKSVLPIWCEAAGRDALAGAALARSMLEEDDSALEHWLKNLAPMERGGVLDLSKLQNAPRALMRRALHRWLLRHPETGNLSRAGFEALLAMAMAGKPTRFSLGVKVFAVIREGRLHIERICRKSPSARLRL